ncbi:MAG: PAS domain S-box protein [Deltaproteobacteria bacterium]
MGISFSNKSVCRLQPHDHACLIYHDEDEWSENVIPFIVQGLQQGEKCIYALNSHDQEQIIDYLRKAGIDTKVVISSGQLLILDQKALPEPNDKDRLTQMGDFFIEFLNQCLKEGYRAIRFTCESMHTMTGFAQSSNLVETNSRCNSLIFPHYPIISLCQYDRWKTAPSLLKEAIISHPIIIRNNILYQNFPWIPDENFLSATREHWETEHWLRTIERENRERQNLYMLRQTIEKSTQAMLAVKPNGKLLAYNQAFRDLIGLSADQMPDLPKYISQWDLFFLETVKEIELGGSFHRFQKSFLTQEGFPITLDITACKKYDITGNLEFYYGSVADITRQMTAEEALRKSESLYNLITKNAYDLICILDRESFIVKYVSPSHERVVGFKPEELIGHVSILFVHPDDYLYIWNALVEGIAKGSGYGEFRWRAKDGSYLWLGAYGHLIQEGAYAGDILIVSRNISEKKQADLALKKELEYKNYLIDNMNEVFVTYDSSAHITLVNSSATRVLGYDPRELQGMHVLDFLAAGGKTSAAEQIRTRLQKGEAGVFETTVLRKDGSECLARIKSSPIIENGVILGSMLLLEDVSEIRKIEREMARLSQLHTIGEMAAGIGHEIRNPMTTVKGFLQIMGENEDFSKHRPYFNIMLEELERANEIISEFLALAKNKRVDLQLCNLNDIIVAIYPLLQADATLGDKGIYLDLQEDIPELFLDEKEIRQLLINLVRNGLEAMEAEGNIFISTYLEGGSVILSVRDEGKGIAPELLDKLGTPFFTTKESGTGLGLAVCYSIAARHQASIEPVSNSSGTIFMTRFKTSENPIQMKLPLKL